MPKSILSKRKVIKDSFDNYEYCGGKPARIIAFS